MPPPPPPTPATPVRPLSRGAIGSLALTASLLAHVGVAGLLLAGARSGHDASPAPALAGETFELPAPEVVVPLANASPSPDAPAEPGTKPEPVDPRGDERPAPAARSKPAVARPSAAGRPSAGHAETVKGETGEGSGGDKLYGAVGDRSAVDLATAFRRSFAQATSANPAWASAPLGAAGDAVVVVELDDGGHVTSHRVEGAPTPALSAGIRSTLALLGARPFVAKGRVTRLHVAGTIRASEPRDDMHGVYGIGFGDDVAFFALAAGRRIEVRITPR